MVSKTVSICCLAFTVLSLFSAAQTRVNVEGAGTVGGSRKVFGSLEYDIYRSSNGGPTVTGWGQGSHSSHAGGNGQVGIHIAIPIGGRRQRHRNVTDRR